MKSIFLVMLTVFGIFLSSVPSYAIIKPHNEAIETPKNRAKISLKKHKNEKSDFDMTHPVKK
jgi:hypothetical protein